MTRKWTITVQHTDGPHVLSSMTCEVDTVTKAREHFYHVLATALSPYAPPGEGWRMTREPERTEGHDG